MPIPRGRYSDILCGDMLPGEACCLRCGVFFVPESSEEVCAKHCMSLQDVEDLKADLLARRKRYSEIIADLKARKGLAT